MVPQTTEAVPHMQPEMHQAALRKFVSNFFGGSARGLLYASSVFWGIPLLARGLGSTRFGLYAFLATFLRLGYYGAFDCGFSMSITKYAAELDPERDRTEANNIFSAAVLVYLAFSVLLLAGFGISGHHLLASIRPDGMPEGELFRATYLGLLAYCLYLLSNSFFALLAARPGFYLTHWLGSCAISVEVLGITALYFTRMSLTRIFLLQVGIAAGCLIAGGVLARRYYPGLCLLVETWPGRTLAKLMSYSFRVGFLNVAVYMTNFYDKLVVGYFCGVTYIGFYEIAARIVELCRRVPQMIFLPLLPVSSEWNRHRGVEPIAKLYRYSLRLMILLTVPIFLTTAAVAGPFLRSWVGDAYAPASFALTMLCLASVLNSLTLPGTQILSGIGQFRTIVHAASVTLAAYLVLDPLLAWRYGFRGAVVGSATGLACGSVYFVWRTRGIPFLIVERQKVVAAFLFSSSSALIIAIPIYLFFAAGSHVVLRVAAPIVAAGLGLIYLRRACGFNTIRNLLSLARSTGASVVTGGRSVT